MVTPPSTLKPTLATSQLAVYDDVLSANDFERLLAHIEGEDYVHVHAGGVKDVWRPEDGLPLCRRRPFLWSSLPLASLMPGREAQRALDERVERCPTRTPVDSVFDAARALAGAHPELIGEPQAWLAMSGKIFVYPAGTALSWHDDAGSYAGSFIFYAHPAWSAQWGGELLVADPETAQIFRERAGRTAASRRRRKHSFGARDLYDEAILERGLGRFVTPRPNRLVLLAGEQPHMLARVSPSAGNRCRISVAGFFLTALGLSELARSAARPGEGW